MDIGKSPSGKVVKALTGEVHNYIIALDYGLKRLQELPLSLRL